MSGLISAAGGPRGGGGDPRGAGDPGEAGAEDGGAELVEPAELVLEGEAEGEALTAGGPPGGTAGTGNGNVMVRLSKYFKIHLISSIYNKN